MSIQSNFPAIAPTLNLSFALTKTLDPRITFTRASTATYYGTQTAKAEENLLLQSQDITTTWLNSNSTDAGNTSVAPDGSTTADTLTDNNTSGSHIVRQTIANFINTTYVVSCFLKAGTSNYACLGFYDPAVVQRYFSADFNLSAGTVRTSAAGTSGTLTSSSITSVGNGWYRCVIVGQVSVGTSQSIMIGVSDGSTAFNNFGTIGYVGANSTIEVWGAQLEQRSAVTAYTATTTQTITNYIPVLQTAASGVARFDHNPTTFESLGLLIEEQRTNLLTYSEQFDNAAWTKTNSSITANTIVAPDGALTGDKLIETATTGSHYVAQTFSALTGVYSVTCYIKAAERTNAILLASAGTTQRAVGFNLSTGTTYAEAIGGVSPPDLTSDMTSVGNGWWRCRMSWTADGQTGIRIYTDSGTGTGTTTGDGYSGIYIWGAELEAGAFPTSYIQTVASQVTRSADSASMTGTNFSSWYNQAQGTLYGEAATYDVSAARISFAVTDGTTSNRIQIGHGLNPKGFIATGGVSQMSQNVVSVVFTNNTFSKMSLSYANNSGNVAANGTLGTLDTAITLPLVDQLRIGVISGTTGTINGTIKKLAYYPLASTSAQLQGLTS